MGRAFMLKEVRFLIGHSRGHRPPILQIDAEVTGVVVGQATPGLRLRIAACLGRFQTTLAEAIRTTAAGLVGIRERLHAGQRAHHAQALPVAAAGLALRRRFLGAIAVGELEIALVPCAAPDCATYFLGRGQLSKWRFHLDIGHCTCRQRPCHNEQHEHHARCKNQPSNLYADLHFFSQNSY